MYEKYAVLTAAVKPRVVVKELVGPWGETFTCVPWEKPEKQWIARSRPKMNFPANVLTFQETGAFNEGGWAKSNTSVIYFLQICIHLKSTLLCTSDVCDSVLQAISEMKNSAIDCHQFMSGVVIFDLGHIQVCACVCVSCCARI